ISAAPDAKPWAGQIDLVAKATVAGKEVVREVRSATITWPVPGPNVPSISRLDRGLIVAVREPGPFHLRPSADKIAINQGEKINLTLHLERDAKDFNAPVQITALNLPQGLNVQPLLIQPG